VRAQGFALATADDPSLAMHDGDASNFTSVKRQEQGASRCGGNLRCEIATLYAGGALVNSMKAAQSRHRVDLHLA
jgi:hypothetical protein